MAEAKVAKVGKDGAGKPRKGPLRRSCGQSGSVSEEPNRYSDYAFHDEVPQDRHLEPTAQAQQPRQSNASSSSTDLEEQKLSSNTEGGDGPPPPSPPLTLDMVDNPLRAGKSLYEDSDDDSTEDYDLFGKDTAMKRETAEKWDHR